MTAATTTELTTLIRTYTNAVWNDHHVDAMDLFYTPDYRHHDVSRPDVTSLDDY